MDYQKLHDDLSHAYYNGLPFDGEVLTKERFDALHDVCMLQGMKESRIRDVSIEDIDARLAAIPSEIKTKIETLEQEAAALRAQL